MSDIWLNPDFWINNVFAVLGALLRPAYVWWRLNEHQKQVRHGWKAQEAPPVEPYTLKEFLIVSSCGVILVVARQLAGKLMTPWDALLWGAGAPIILGVLVSGILVKPGRGPDEM